MEVTINQIKAEIEVLIILSSHFMEVFNFADLHFKYNGNSHELKHLCKLKDIIRKLDEHYESMFSKKNSEPSNRGPIHAEWLYNQAKYVKEKYIGFWKKYVEKDPIYNKYRKLYNKYLKQILN
jgi:hypothetical protein